MELHSYAKRKASKKWTVQQKRRLVETRISCDQLFVNQRNSMLPWRKILSLANLDDFSIFFVRKQWSSMVAKYKQYKQNRLDNIPTQSIDDNTIRKISDEWEFFYPIHRFMTDKTTNLHSYAQKLQADDPTEHKNGHHHNHDDDDDDADNDRRREDQTDDMNSAKRLKNAASSTEQLNVFSSDTNEEFVNVMPQQQSESLAISMNTDHDFYTKPSMQKECNYFADVSEDTHESMIVELTTTQTASHEVPVSSAGRSAGHQSTNRHTNGLAQLSERDKYYRHKRRFNRRLEKRFDSLLNVFGQIVKAEYPNIDVSPIMSTASASANLLNNLFSSDDDDEDDAVDDAVDDDGDDAVDNKRNQSVNELKPTRFVVGNCTAADNRQASETIEEMPLSQ